MNLKILSKKDKKIYSAFHIKFLEDIISKKRLEISCFINNYLAGKNLKDVLDIGTTNDLNNPSSNIIVKNLKGFNQYKSISNQIVKDNFFSKCLNKSICENFSQDEIDIFSSDLVISNATIEHVGNRNNQINMINNIIKLSKKYFIIITPNRNYPIEFHTKLPLIHLMPKKIHRLILSILGYKFLSLEENLNLLKYKDIVQIMKILNFKTYEIKFINFLYFKSNIILIGFKS